MRSIIKFLALWMGQIAQYLLWGLHYDYPIIDILWFCFRSTLWGKTFDGHQAPPIVNWLDQWQPEDSDYIMFPPKAILRRWFK